MLYIEKQDFNSPGDLDEKRFGRFSLTAARPHSRDFYKAFPAEVMLRTFEFEPYNPIKNDASIGQSVQTIRFLSANDGQKLKSAVPNVA
jgi:hypothetical protein